MINPVALSVRADEPCWILDEQSRIMAFPDGSRLRRRVQRLHVVRGDELAEFETDFGPAEDFDIPPIFLMSPDGSVSVAHMQEEAEKHRHNLQWAKRREEMLAESTVIPDILRHAEEAREWVANRSRFGPGGAVLRNT